MSISETQLNLARKWRPRQFGGLVGQDLTMRILKNSLYKGTVFPVYIFAGQRGCGKTSTARIFAAALNCEQQDAFRAQPAQVNLPCLSCESCRAMQAGNHPDFIEIDAASHTGVDNVRYIIDSAAHLPVSSRVKIYLIDEAHMLSRAAFNAFLKVLEEPPAAVRFILATTEIDKIPDTVRSRSFQLFFNPVDPTILLGYLQKICTEENIAIDEGALRLVVHECEGAIRDAINMLERVRFLGTTITRELVLQTLGRVSEEQIFALVELLLEANVPGVFAHLTALSFESLRPGALWGMLVQTIRALVWIKYGVVANPGGFEAHQEALEALAKKSSLPRLNAMLQLLWSHEPLWLQTDKKHAFFEMVLVQLCELKLPAEASKPAKTAPVAPAPVQRAVVPPPAVESVNNSAWGQLCEKINGLNDLLLSSIWQQAECLGVEDKKLQIRLRGMNRFFEQALADKQGLMLLLAQELFPGIIDLVFSAEQLSSATPAASAAVVRQTRPTTQPTRPSAPSRPPSRVDTSDAEKWPKAQAVSAVFPGTIEAIKTSSGGDTHE